MARHDRRGEIRRRRTRAKSLARLRARYQRAKTDTERSRLLGKSRKVSPTLTREQFLGEAEKTGA